MTREALIKHWDVIQAFKEGKQTQYKDLITPEWKNIDDPQFKLDVQYRVNPESTKRLPTIQEIEKWFLENKVFYHKLSNMVTRIIVIDRNQSEKQIGLQGGWISICDFIEEFTHLDGSELYITE